MAILVSRIEKGGGGDEKSQGQAHFLAEVQEVKDSSGIMAGGQAGYAVDRIAGEGDMAAFHELVLQERAHWGHELDDHTRPAYRAWLREAEEAHHAAVLARAARTGIPVEIRDGDSLQLLRGFENGEPLYWHTLNVNAAQTTGANLLRLNPDFDPALPNGVSGEGFYVTVSDGGVMHEHTEFQLPNGGGSRIIHKGGSSTEDHATHVAGTLGAWGYNTSRIGMAPRVWFRSLVTFANWQASTFGMAWPGETRADNNPRTGESERQSVVGNVSLGGTDTRTRKGLYTFISAGMDQILWDTPYYLQFFAAGNAGSNFATLDIDYSVTKNAFTIGSINTITRDANGDYQSGGAIGNTSSRGPTYDGRIKPDFVARGVNVSSTTGTTGSSTMSGTSMATPGAAGSAVLLIETFHRKFPGHYPRASTVRALFAATADDLGPEGPDYAYGFGAINVYAAAGIVRDVAGGVSGALLLEEVLADGASWEMEVLSTGGPVSLALSWTEPAGAGQMDNDSATRAARLVNDLDMRLIGPLGGTEETHLPWVHPFTIGHDGTPAYDDSLRSLGSVRGDNFTDNTELLQVADLPAGTYRIEITHKGALSGGMQIFSLAGDGLHPLNAPDPRVDSIEQIDGAAVSMVEIIGSEFPLGTDVRLRRPGLEVAAFGQEVSGSRLLVRIAQADLSEDGLYDVVLRLPDGREIVEPNAFLKGLPSGATEEVVFWQTDFSSAAGWTLGAGWAIGVPNLSAMGGPAAAVTGGQVLATNLNGTPTNANDTFAMSPAISTVGMTGLTLNVRRWNRINNNTYCNQTIHFKTSPGGSGTQIYRHWTAVNDGNWQVFSYSMASGAQNQASIWLDFGLGSDAQSFGWNVDEVWLTYQRPVPLAPPTFTSLPVTEGEIGEAYSYSITATDDDTPTGELTFGSAALPAWLTLTDHGDGTATLSGTPQDPGQYAVAISVSDGDYVNWQSFDLMVSLDQLPPPFALTYYANSGSGGTPAPHEFLVGATVTVPEAGTLAKPSHAFNGWRDVLGAVTYAPGDTFVMPARDVTLAAQWTALGVSEVFEESFETRNLGPVSGQGNWGVSAVANAEDWKVVEGGLDGAGGYISGDDRSLRIQTTSNQEFLLHHPIGEQTGPLYLRLNFQCTGATSSTFLAFGLTADATNNFNNSVMGTYVGTAVRARARDASTNTEQSVNHGLNANSVFTFVLKAEKTNPAGNYDRVTLFVNPDLSAGSAAPASGNATATRDIGHDTLTHFFLRGGATGRTYTVDSIAVGRSWQELTGAAPGTGHTVTYDAGGGTGTAPVDGNQYAAGSTVTVMGQGNLTRAGFTFAGWHDGTTLRQPLDTFAMPDAYVTLTARWSGESQTYTVTFLNYDASVLKMEQVESGQTATAPADPVRAGYTFTGWDVPFDNISSDLTVTAQWEPIPEPGDWILQDDFETYTAGSAPGTPWTLSGSEMTVEADDFGNSGQFLAQGGESGATLRRALTDAIPADSTAATLFYRFRTSGGNENQSFGLTDVAEPSNWTDFRVQMGVVNNVLQIRDGDNTRDFSIAGSTWYRLWLVVNNNANTYRIYLQGGDFAEPTLVTVGGQSTFAFRTNSSGALTTLFGRVGGGTFPPVFYDDLYLALDENLTLPAESFDEVEDWWRSDLYRAGWTPPTAVNFFTDPFLQDFSYAGYQRGEQPLPEVISPVFDVTDPAYGADPTGTSDSTAAIQAAIDAAASAGGGVVYLPAGTYRVAPVGSNAFALRIQSDNIVLRGAGVGETHILNTETNMRTRSVILVEAPSGGNWLTQTGTPVTITADLMGPAMVIPVASTSGFAVGDWLVVRADLTTELAADLNMGDLWDTPARRDGLGGILFYRRITAVDAVNLHLHIDAPTRFALLVRDNARVHHTVELLEQVGLEHFSIGNLQHPGTGGWGEEDYTNSSRNAYEVHSSQLVTWRGARDSWMQSVHSYHPPANTKQVHMLSNGVVLHNTRGLTLRDVSMERAQYGGGGGNGYMIRMSSAQETLVQDSRAAWSRHGFVFSGMQTSGNVIHRGLAEETKWSAEGTTNGSGSDHHMHFSQSNLIDTVTVDRDYFEAAWRGTWGTIPHGMTATHTTYWNLEGLRYGPDSQNTIIHTEQFAYGYVIGTRGPASNVLRRTNQTSRTDPADIIEGVGQGDILYPFSLYEDQLARRLDPEFDPGPLYDDATLVAVLGVTDPEPGTQTGTPGDPITWSVNVPETVTALAPADIVAVDFAVAQLFSDSNYTTEITVGNTMALTESTPTIAYVLVTAEDQVTKLHYSVSISRVQAFSITYNANGGGNAPVDANDYLAGETATVLGAGAMTRAVYEFTTWNTAPDGNGVTFLPGDTFEIQDDITLYAQWRYVLAQYNFGQAGPTTPPSGVFATVTAGEVQGWGEGHDLSTNASPGSGSYDSTPILTILKNAGANYDVGFFFDLEIPEGAGLNLSRLAFDASSGGSAGRKFKLGYVIDPPAGAPTGAVDNLLGEQAPQTTRYEWTPYEVDLAGISELQNLSGVTVRFVWSVSISNQWSMDFDSITLNADIAVQDAPATVLYVNHAASGGNNGSSWANAFTSLRDALAAAQAGQEIWVAAGSYNPFVSNRATDTFLLPSAVAVYGGFAGTESERDQRDWLAHETILSGHIEGQINIGHIVTATGAEDTRIDGFTIRDGHSDGDNPYADGVGAAVFVGQGEGRLTLANCRIVDNHAREGGVVYFDANANNPSLRIENTVFADNAIGSEWARGVLQIRSNAAEVWIEDSRFENNPSGIFSEAGNLQVLSSQFIAQSGIAVDINYHGAVNDFVNCVFDQNGGGAIRMVNSQQLRVANCVFTGNTNPYGSGGALNIGQGRFEVYNSTFYGNSADEGAAIAWNYGWAGDATSLIHNSIFWGNTGDNVILLERYTDDSMTLELRNNLLQGGATSVATWADPVVVVSDLIDSDPLFVDASNLPGADGRWGTADDGLRLQASSPAANAGSASLLPADWLDVNANADVDESLPLDLMGAARVQGGQPSLGAYETLEQGQPAPDAYADWAANNNITGGLTDATGGIANLLRYALGGDADTAIGALQPQLQSSVDQDGLTLSLTFQRIVDPLLTYAVWFSEDLEDWGATPTWQGTGAHEGEPSAFTVEVLVPAPGNRGFLRLEVSRDE